MEDKKMLRNEKREKSAEELPTTVKESVIELTDQEAMKVNGGIGFGDLCPKCGEKIKVMKNDFNGHLLCKNCGAILQTYVKEKGKLL